MQGATEFSFEELRGFVYQRKSAEQEAKRIKEEKQRWTEEQNRIMMKQVRTVND